MAVSTIHMENDKLIVGSYVKEMWINDLESQNDVDKGFARVKEVFRKASNGQ